MMLELIVKPVRTTLALLLLTVVSPSSMADVFINPKSNLLTLHIGSLEPVEKTGAFENPSSELSFGFSHSSQSRHHPYLAVDLEMWLLNNEYRNTLQVPSPAIVDNEMELETATITVGARLIHPYDSRLRFYVSGGMGYFSSQLFVNTNLFGIPGSYEDSTQGFGPYIGAGLTVHLGRRQTLELYYRRWDYEGDFSTFNIPDTDIGPEAFGLGFGVYW